MRMNHGGYYVFTDVTRYGAYTEGRKIDKNLYVSEEQDD